MKHVITLSCILWLVAATASAQVATYFDQIGTTGVYKYKAGFAPTDAYAASKAWDDSFTAIGAALTAYAEPADYNYYNVSMWGDSLTSLQNTILPTTLTGHAVYVYGNSGDSSTQIKVRMLAATNNLDHVTIIWAGRNNHDDVATVKADIAAMVAALGANTNYLILSVINGEYADEYVGGESHTNIVAINTYLEATYPNNFYDIREYLVSQFDAGTPQDVTDHGHDIVPSTLRSDGIHLNATGSQLVATKISEFLAAHLTPTTDKRLSHLDVPAIFADPPPIGQLTFKSGSPIMVNGMAMFRANTSKMNFFLTGAGNTTATGTNNTGIGAYTLDALSTGSYNFGLGYNAIGSLQDADSNVAIGMNALATNVSGDNNVAIGTQALQNSTGFADVAIGFQALNQRTSGAYNVAVGWSSLFGVTDGNFNAGVGSEVLYALTTGSYNAALGHGALQYVGTGSSNTAIGRYAGTYQADGTTGLANPESSTYIGYATRGLNNDDDNSTVVGANAIGKGANTTVLGNTSTASTYLYGAMRLMERSADPAKPAEGEMVIWMSDGTGLGDDGDVMIGGTAGGVVKYTTLFDHSAGTTWE